MTDHDQPAPETDDDQSAPEPSHDQPPPETDGDQPAPEPCHDQPAPEEADRPSLLCLPFLALRRVIHRIFGEL
ncbi:MAG: hypothetical protein LBI31_00890, partial [Zoogloeaceae bacterium]|nr:hypothetical protein [Zoogloeaceae bacterium]